MSTCTALIVAAGRGSRFGGPLPKQYALLAGRPVLRHTVEAYRTAPGINNLRVVIAPGDEIHYRAAVEGLALPPPSRAGSAASSRS
jgi:2-C-methyl-D-erythritol 4-phosphate cytidylyltransferase/2-C-methyl-D-erythritol 2,4-cyclodiphosphate synthase